jgi:hypothetical protein
MTKAGRSSSTISRNRPPDLPISDRCVQEVGRRGQCAGHLLHAQFAITMEIYTEVSDEAARAGLKKPDDGLR